MNIVYFGTPQFAADVLDYLIKQKVPISAVITKPDKPKGRSGEPVQTPVKKVALEHDLPVFQPEIVSEPGFAQTLADFNPDLFVVVAYGEIIKQHLLDMPKRGCINLHASLLPKWRGAAPIQHSIIHGDQKTGVTIMHMAKKMDAGDVISMVKVPIPQNMTFGELEKALCEAGQAALLDVIHDFEKGNISRTPQDHTQATYAPKIELEDCELHWDKSAQELHNLVRGVNPYPGAWCYIKMRGGKKRLKVLRTTVERDVSGAPGSVIDNAKGLVIACGNEGLNLIELQLEGKKAMTAEEFLRGIPKSALEFVSVC